MNRIRLAFVVAAALLAGTARGQGAAADKRVPLPPPPAPPARTLPQQTSQAAPAPAGRSVEAEKLEAAADNLARMKAALKLVLGRAEQARNEKDVVKLNCVNEKLTQMKALFKAAEQAEMALRDAVTTRKGNGEVESSKLAIARTKVDALRRGAEQCIGQLAYMIDERTTIDVEQPSLPGSRDGDLGVAHRGEDPADSVTEIGVPQGPGEDPACVGRGTPFCPPPVVRPPPASAYTP